MIIEYFGHSCVRLTSSGGMRFVIDPYEGIGYQMPRMRADVVLCTHGHFDHHNIAGVAGEPKVIESVGSFTCGGVRITGVAAFHDDVGGAKRGRDIVYILEDGDTRVCHLGDIGELPRADLLRAIGKVDVLFVPVGGTYTVDAEGALAYIQAARPRVAMAIHYSCEGCSLDISTVQPLCRLAGSRCVQLGGCVLDTDDLSRYIGKIVIAERKRDAGE